LSGIRLCLVHPGAARTSSELCSDGQGTALSHLLALALFCTACAPHPSPQKLTVAAAADLNFALPEIARQFRAIAPAVELQIAYGSSGSFFAQIGNGAPFDVFLSADVAYPRKLATAGVGAGNSVFTYAVGRLVVWVPAASPLDPATALREVSVKHIAIANPQHAPYGRAAQAALRTLGLEESVQAKLVLGENIAQTLQFVESGAADVGIVALSLALAPPVRARGRYWQIPLDAYPRVEQGGIILKDSQAARDFRAFLLSAAGRRILKQYGFFVPGE
jgi:molybdate transport system substrate-binding protein